MQQRGLPETMQHLLLLRVRHIRAQGGMRRVRSMPGEGVAVGLRDTLMRCMTTRRTGRHLMLYHRMGRVESLHTFHNGPLGMHRVHLVNWRPVTLLSSHLPDHR